MTDDFSEPTLGEVYRLCQSIDKKVDVQNGRVRKLEDDALRIKTVWTLGVAAIAVFAEPIKRKLGL